MHDDTASLLSQSHVFQGIPKSQIQELARIAEPGTYRPGDLIFSEGDDATGFYFVVSGQVKIYKMSFEGREQVLHFVGPGEIFAEVPVYSGGTYPANADALRETRTFFFPRRAIRRLLASDPNLAMVMLADLSKRLRQLTNLVENLSLKESPARLAAYLLYASEELTHADRIELDVTKGQLATLLGTTPETLSRTLKKMTDNGLIEVQGRTITLLDKAGLEQIAAG